jgi:hypothetical protein
VIELLIEAFSIALLNREKICKTDHFSEAFSKISGAPLGYSPFTMPNYQENFDQDKMFELYEKTRQRTSHAKR